MKRQISSYLAIAFASLAIFIGGCGPSGRAPIAQTTGVVQLGGKPVEGVKVTFLPLQAGSSNFSHGTTDKDGKFTMSTFGLNDGALVGRHSVIVTKIDVPAENKLDPAELAKSGYGGAGYKEMMGPGKKKELKNELPKKYADAKTSGIEISVEAGISNECPINLTP